VARRPAEARFHDRASLHDELKGRLFSRLFSLRISLRISWAKPFITHSGNKLDGTMNTAEHHSFPFVVGVGNANT
jgi:hypothetical protein